MKDPAAQCIWHHRCMDNLCYPSLVLFTLPTTFGASDCDELCILHQMITCRLSGCQRLEGDLPEPRRRVGVERVGGDAATGAWLAWSCLVAVFKVAAADPVEQR